jgi:hypothetical protein
MKSALDLNCVGEWSVLLNYEKHGLGCEGCEAAAFRLARVAYMRCDT